MSESTNTVLTTGDLQDVTTYQAGIMQASVHRLLQKQCDDILKPYGISKVQWLIIGTALDAGDKGIRITDLATTLGTTLPFLTTTISILELKNILTRDSNGSDSRSKLVRVHPDFVPQCAAIEQTMRDQLRKSIYAHIDVADFHTYMKVLYQLGEIGRQQKK